MKQSAKTPIVLAAFGTTSRALATYERMNLIFKAQFPGHDIRWAYSSRMVRNRLKRDKGIDLHPPGRVLADLAAAGHCWAVVQSLHLICGHEFYRLSQEAAASPLRIALGLPLLTAPEDYLAVADALEKTVTTANDEAVVLVGHGTDHPAWTAYAALHQVLIQRHQMGVQVGVVEDGFPERGEIVARIHRFGYRRVRLIPFMLVAGVHFREDMAGPGDSWKSAFEKKGISVSLENTGLGDHDDVTGIFCEHTRSALDVIPMQTVPL